MKTIRLFSITFFSLLISISCTVHATKTENSRQTRTVSAFHGISVSTGIEVYLTQKDIQEVRVEADEEDMDELITKVEGGILKIYMKEKSLLHMNWNNRPRKVYVSFKSLDKLEASSGSEISTQSKINAERLDVDASSGAEVKLELNASDVSAESSSSAEIKLTGKANTLQVNASSGSEVDASDFETKRCNASASSAAEIRVHVTEQLDAHASSSAEISYSGNPAHKDINESSGGDVSGR